MWGAYTTKASLFLNDAKLDGFDSMMFDKLDLRLCKSILGVHRRTANDAVRGDLGRFPMTLFILKQVFKFWMRVAKGNSNSLLEACYIENVNLVNNGKACWLGHIKNIVLNTLGFQEAWDNQGSTHPKSLLRKLNTSIKNIYINH